jgi:hypothetical protein
MVQTIIFCTAIAGVVLIVLLFADGRREFASERHRRLRIRARASELRAEAALREPAVDPAEQEEAERRAIEARLEAERRRGALVDAGP